MKAQTSEIIWEGVTAFGVINGGLTGRVMSITHQSFNDLMTVTW